MHTRIFNPPSFPSDQLHIYPNVYFARKNRERRFKFGEFEAAMNPEYNCSTIIAEQNHRPTIDYTECLFAYGYLRIL